MATHTLITNPQSSTVRFTDLFSGPGDARLSSPNESSRQTTARITSSPRAASNRSIWQALTGDAQSQARPRPPLLLRVSEVAELLSISRSTAYRLIRTGELPSLKVGGITRVPFDRLCNWVAENTVIGQAA